MRPAPAPGAGLVSFLLLFLFFAACEPGGRLPPDPEVEAARALGLEGGARLIRVVLGGRGAQEHILPQRILARPGDAVEFITVDHRIHRVEFPRDSLNVRAFEFLASNGSEASPPLPARGSRFILRLKGAPPGRYPFFSHGHGGRAHGVIEVTEDSVPRSD